MSKASELRELTDDVLELRLAEAKDELFKLRFGHATGQLEDTNRLTHRPSRDRTDAHAPARARDRWRTSRSQGEA